MNNLKRGLYFFFTLIIGGILGWYANEMSRFAEGVINDAAKNDERLLDIVKTHKIHISDVSKVKIIPRIADTLYSLKSDKNWNYPNLENGIWQIYIDKDFKRKVFECEIHDQKLNGVRRFWWADGSLYSEYHFENGKTINESRVWYRSGTLNEICRYEKGEPITETIWTETGKLNKRYQYINGKYSRETEYDTISGEIEMIFYRNSDNILGSEEFVSVVLDSVGFAKSRFKYSTEIEETEDGDWGILTKELIQ